MATAGKKNGSAAEASTCSARSSVGIARRMGRSHPAVSPPWTHVTDSPVVYDVVVTANERTCPAAMDRATSGMGAPAGPSARSTNARSGVVSRKPPSAGGATSGGRRTNRARAPATVGRSSRYTSSALRPAHTPARCSTEAAKPASARDTRSAPLRAPAETPVTTSGRNAGAARAIPRSTPVW